MLWWNHSLFNSVNDSSVICGCSLCRSQIFVWPAVVLSYFPNRVICTRHTIGGLPVSKEGKQNRKVPRCVCLGLKSFSTFNPFFDNSTNSTAPPFSDFLVHHPFFNPIHYFTFLVDRLLNIPWGFFTWSVQWCASSLRSPVQTARYATSETVGFENACWEWAVVVLQNLDESRTNLSP